MAATRPAQTYAQDPEDDFEEFEEIGDQEKPLDPELVNWEEDVEATGWDERDPDDDFVLRLEKEMEAYKQEYEKQQAAAGKTS